MRRFKLTVWPVGHGWRWLLYDGSVETKPMPGRFPYTTKKGARRAALRVAKRLGVEKPEDV